MCHDLIRVSEVVELRSLHAMLIYVGISGATRSISMFNFESRATHPRERLLLTTAVRLPGNVTD